VTVFYSYMESAVGQLLLVCDADALIEVRFKKSGRAGQPDADWREDKEALRPFTRQLLQYFAGERTQFDLQLDLRGTPFQVQVWHALCDIPYGETISYGELARRIDRPKAFRAVGAANGQNPISIIVPCHRVIGANGKLTGFGGGLPTKEALLHLERNGRNDQLPLRVDYQE
jgi:methylated-DNA-[protein]-cysteine S-methyltransferase